jgi:4-hydroxybenzoate polyprenyltransferase
VEVGLLILLLLLLLIECPRPCGAHRIWEGDKSKSKSKITGSFALVPAPLRIHGVPVPPRPVDTIRSDAPTSQREPVRTVNTELVAVEPVPELAMRIHRAVVLAQRGEDFLHALHLFGAAGIAAFGWAVCRLLGLNAEPWVPLWFCAGVLVYNVDRLRRDPADRLNLPQRATASRRLRGISLLLAAASAATLLVLPIWRRDWSTLALILLGVPVVLNYSIPFRGRRLKDVPYLKSFFAPTLVLLAVLGLPLVHTPWEFPLLATPLVATWAWGLLVANMLLCDVRDIAGDRRTGVVSLPSEIGLVRTRRLLWALAAVTGGVATQLMFFGPTATRGAWLALAMAGTLYVAALALAVSWPRSERFYERWVEGLLFLPAVIVAFFL